MDPATPKPAASQNTSSAADLDSISEQMQQVRAAASTLLDKVEGASSLTDMATAVEKAAEALKLAAEMDKTRTELAKVNQEISKLKYENETASKRERSEQRRNLVTVLTPSVTVITAAVAFLQFLKSENDKREEALDSQWREAEKTILQSEKLLPGAYELQPFLNSRKYGDEARRFAVMLLSKHSDLSLFRDLFNAAFAPVNWSNMGRVVDLDRALFQNVNPVLIKTWDATKKQNDTTQLTEDERLTFNYFQQVMPAITGQIGGALKTPRPPREQIDLSSTYFSTGDWKGIDFDGANLTGVVFNFMDLQDAELKEVTQFNGAGFFGTPWWKVKSINKALLDYLRDRFAFSPGQRYGPRQELPSQGEYDAAISRLTSQLK
jgi:hypothetical protein